MVNELLSFELLSFDCFYTFIWNNYLYVGVISFVVVHVTIPSIVRRYILQYSNDSISGQQKPDKTVRALCIFHKGDFVMLRPKVL